MSEYPRTEGFFKETVKLTVDEYLVRPNNIRRGRLAAIVLSPSSRYAYPAVSRLLLQRHPLGPRRRQQTREA